jgi:hypothetical protein
MGDGGKLQNKGAKIDVPTFAANIFFESSPDSPQIANAFEPKHYGKTEPF